MAISLLRYLPPLNHERLRGNQEFSSLGLRHA